MTSKSPKVHEIFYNNHFLNRQIKKHYLLDYSHGFCDGLTKIMLKRFFNN